MVIYKIFRQLYKGDFPVTITVDAEMHESNEAGEIVDPSNSVARMLEGMPEWERVEGNSPFGVNDVVANTLRTRE